MVVSYGNALVRSARAEGQSGHLHSSFGDLPCAPAEPCRPMELAWFLDALMHRDRTYLIEQYCRTSWKIGRTTHSVTHTHTHHRASKMPRSFDCLGCCAPHPPKWNLQPVKTRVSENLCIDCVLQGCYCWDQDGFVNMCIYVSLAPNSRSTSKL